MRGRERETEIIYCSVYLVAHLIEAEQTALHFELLVAFLRCNGWRKCVVVVNPNNAESIHAIAYVQKGRVRWEFVGS